MRIKPLRWQKSERIFILESNISLQLLLNHLPVDIAVVVSFYYLKYFSENFLRECLSIFFSENLLWKLILNIFKHKSKCCSDQFFALTIVSKKNPCEIPWWHHQKKLTIPSVQTCIAVHITCDNEMAQKLFPNKWYN